MIRILFVLALAGCAADGAPWSGEALPETLKLSSPTEGVHPDRSVLEDPHNPFVDGHLSDQTVWQLQSNATAVGCFYAWATNTARGATGERQYYAALNLKTIYEAGLADEGELPAIREAAIGGTACERDDEQDANHRLTMMYERTSASLPSRRGRIGSST
jgi:hypothetical protein